jgi:Zn-finger nucleic acid-binding protein
MNEIQVEDVIVDQCESCKGIWFDQGEAENLASQLVARYVDTGDPQVGESMDENTDTKCPHCDRPMRIFFELENNQVQWEQCDVHGKFFDAGEFTLWAENYRKA